MILLRQIRVISLALLSALTLRAAPSGHPPVTIETVKTSIYIGSVTLYTTPLVWKAGTYSADYHAKVFPYFFSNEKGHLSIEFSDEMFAHLARGEVVYFKGHAENTDHEPRRIEGRAVPADAKHGKIKVRVFVTEKIQLIFNAGFRFAD